MGMIRMGQGNVQGGKIYQRVEGDFSLVKFQSYSFWLSVTHKHAKNLDSSISCASSMVRYLLDV